MSINFIICVILLFLIYLLSIEFYILIRSSKGKSIDLRRRNYIPAFNQNINVIIYSHNNGNNIVELVESLKKQDYDYDKYCINVILDNCEDDSAKLLEIIGGTRLWRINTDIKPIGRNKAIAWLLERILSTENTNSFVFINADCKVKPDFLAKINAFMYDNPVLIGEVCPENSDLNLMSKIAYFKNKIQNRIFIHGRHYASLGNIIDQEVLAIRQDILEKINFSITDYSFEEYNYSVKLAQSKIPVAFSHQVCVFKPFSESMQTLATNIHKKRYKNLITFKNKLPLLFSIDQSFRTKELILSLIYPSNIIFLVLLALLACFVNTKIFVALTSIYITNKLFAMIVAKSNIQDYKNAIMWVILNPIIFWISIVQGFKLNLSFKFSLPKRFLLNGQNNHKQVIDIVITDKKKDLPCKLELRQNYDNAQAIFIFNNKKLASAKYPRIDYALEELLEKLSIHGFDFKICLNCGYFKFGEELRSKFGGEQGYCLFDNVNNDSNIKKYSYIWNSCPSIISTETREFIMKQFNKKILNNN